MSAPPEEASCLRKTTWSAVVAWPSPPISNLRPLLSSATMRKSDRWTWQTALPAHRGPKARLLQSRTSCWNWRGSPGIPRATQHMSTISICRFWPMVGSTPMVGAGVAHFAASDALGPARWKHPVRYDMGQAGTGFWTIQAHSRTKPASGWMTNASRSASTSPSARMMTACTRSL